MSTTQTAAASGGGAGRKGRLQQVAAGRRLPVEHFAGGEYAGQAAQLVDDRLMRQRRDLACPLRVDARNRRIAAHSAGVRPLVAVEDALVVLRRRHRDRTLAVAQGEQRELVALEELLDEHAGLAEPALPSRC